jgi:hypothetical protein
VSVLQIAQGGAEVIEAMRQEADRLGLTLTDKQANDMPKVNDQLARMSAATTGLANSVAVQTGPAVTEFLTKIYIGLPKAATFGEGAIAAMSEKFYGFAASIEEALASTVMSTVTDCKGLDVLEAIERA